MAWRDEVYSEARPAWPGPWLLAAVLLLAAATAVAQPDTDARVSLSNTPTLAQLVELSAQQFGVDIEYNPTDLNAKLTLRSADSYTPAELWELTHRMLEADGRTTVLAPGERRLYRVVSLAEAASATEPMDSIPTPAPGYVVMRYPVRSADPADVATALNDPKPPLWQASVSPDKSAVLVGALVRRQGLARSVIEAVDSEAASVRVEVIEARHADPVTVVAAVNAAREQLPGRVLDGRLSVGPRSGSLLLVGPEADLGGWRELIARFDVPQPAETRGYPLPSFGADELTGLLDQVARRAGPRGSGDLWKVVQSPLTATLLVTATPEEHARVSALLTQLEAVPAEQRRATRAFTVRNRKAEDLRSSLSRLLGVSLGEEMSEAAVSETGEPEALPPSRGGAVERNDLVLAVDPELNAIIAVGTPALLDEAASLIARLDVRQPQVQLEVLLVSLSEGESKDLGVELQARFGDSGTLFGLGSLFGLSNIGPDSTTPTVGGSGGTAVILDPGDFSVVVKALETVSRGRSISSASTLVNNNESATLSNTVQQPYATTTLDDGDSITGFGGSESAGTQVSVSPQIAEGGFLVLDYDVSLSAFLGEATSDGLPPPSQSTAVSSVATIPDGYTIAVGGLELLSESDADSKTPLLADIPILGNLFKSQTESSSRTRFYVFIKASILRSPGFQELRYLSDVASDEAGVGWPRVKPRVIR